MTVKDGAGIPGQDRIYAAGEKEHEKRKLVREPGIPVNRNLRRDLQTLRDELGIAGYETYFQFRAWNGPVCRSPRQRCSRVSGWLRNTNQDRTPSPHHAIGNVNIYSEAVSDAVGLCEAKLYLPAMCTIGVSDATESSAQIAAWQGGEGEGA